MKKLQIIWKGTTPLIMHSCRCVNPLHPLAKGIKVYTSKRNKTDEDYAIMADYEWLMGAYYLNDNIECPYMLATDKQLKSFKDVPHDLYIPAENIEATLINGGKANKKGTDIKKFIMLTEPFIPFKVLGNPSFETMMTEYKYRDVRQMVVQRNRVTRTRPRFDSWEIDFMLQYDETKIDIETLVNAIEYAGKYVGLCDSRPKYGQFTAIINEIE